MLASIHKKNIQILPSDHYLGNAVEVAQTLLGMLLIRNYQGMQLGGIITEVEAYQGEEDQGCHAKAGFTQRTRVMYGPPGNAYIYFTYGMHWMLNAVTGAVGKPAAVLIRSIHPIFGLETMRILRPGGLSKPGNVLQKGWTDGPAKICQAMGLDGTLNGTNLCDPEGELWIGDAGIQIPTEWINTTPRIGLFSVPEPWKSIPWRWVVKPEMTMELMKASSDKACCIQQHRR